MPNAESPHRPRPTTSARAIALLAAVAVGVFALDQSAKQLVIASLAEGERVEVLGALLQWHHVRNPGAAFSMASGMTWVFSLLATAVVVAIVVSARRIHSIAWAIVLGAVLGGTLGNLFDRLFRPPGFAEGHVVDFISTPWLMPAIYNLADIAIVGGMIAFVALTLFDVRLDGRPRRSADEADADAAADDADAASGADTASGADAGGPDAVPASDADGAASDAAPASDADERGSEQGSRA